MFRLSTQVHPQEDGESNSDTGEDVFDQVAGGVLAQEYLTPRHEISGAHTVMAQTQEAEKADQKFFFMENFFMPA